MNSLFCGGYEFRFEDGGVEIIKDGKCLYFNKRPIYISVKDISALCTFKDVPYDKVSLVKEKVTQGTTRNIIIATGTGTTQDISFSTGSGLTKDTIVATGNFTSENGSGFAITDKYTVIGDEMKISRNVRVIKKADRDLGFQSKIGFWTTESENIEDFDYFAPGEWYKNNEYASPMARGKDTSLSYYWRKETYSGLPMFAMQNKKSGETLCISRFAADVRMNRHDIVESESFIDRRSTVGALGISKPKAETILYTYYGAKLSKPEDVRVDGLSIDYVYPGTNGELKAPRGGMSLKRVNHPIEPGFVHEYSIVITPGNYDSFQNMMRATWRKVYSRLKDDLADIDNKLLFDNNMKLLKQVTNEYTPGVWGTPFAAQLPDFDVNSTSSEIGFVGQQTGIGYQLIRWGTLNGDSVAIKKGKGIVDFWVNKTMTETGCPKVWYQMGLDVFEPQPQFVREIGDGLEGILDAYVFLHNHGEEKTSWLDYCEKTADWLVAHQNEDGSYYRSYNYDGSMCMDSKANTPSVVRFLAEMYFVLPKETYREAAIKAGEWSYENMFINMEYRGGTCDNADIQDKEAGIYALFAFLALYDLTEDSKWIEASKGAADYVETFTYIWNYPVATNFPTMPFNRNHISGQSHIVVGMGGADVYMACGGYVYYRLYLLTGDEHYRDYAEFIYLNSKQANDIDGRHGAAIPGLVHESGFFCEQLYQGNYHWLPWCTFVEVDPVSRMYDTFGAYEIAQVDKLSWEDRVKMNRIYDNWYK